MKSTVLADVSRMSSFFLFTVPIGAFSYLLSLNRKIELFLSVLCLAMFPGKLSQSEDRYSIRAVVVAESLGY